MATGAVVGFSGSRSLAASSQSLVAGHVMAIKNNGRAIVTGCARGLDAYVRAASPDCLVFKVSDYGVGLGAFARRSIAMVDYVAKGETGSGIVAYPASQCPLGLIPAAKSSKCFSGKGNGTWATMAYAAGLGLPVVVFPCGFSELPNTWGRWEIAGSGIWSTGHRFVAHCV